MIYIDTNKQKIPMGANRIIISTIFNMRLFPDIKKLTTCSLDDNDLTPKPTIKEKTIICNISPFAMAWIGFVGKIFIKTSLRDCGLGAVNSTFVMRPTPLPILKKFEKKRAKEIAIEVVTKYKRIALKLIDPNLDESVIWATPVTKEKNTNGTTISFNEAIKIAPKILKNWIENDTSSFSKKNRFTKEPNRIPANIEKRILVV